MVEDEPALAQAVSEALVDAGFNVDRASDGEEGLTRLTEANYDLIVCDLKMPRIDGMQFYRAMATATPALARRVIFVTGDVAGTDAERFLEETGCRWLSKPFRLGDLLRSARDTLVLIRSLVADQDQAGTLLRCMGHARIGLGHGHRRLL